MPSTDVDGSVIVVLSTAEARRVYEHLREIAGGPGLDDVIIVGPLRIDRRAHRVKMDDGGESTELSLTPKEFELLVFLAEDAGAVRTRTDIIEHVWDANWYGPTKTVDAHVAGIRRKLGDARWIAAIRGVGFRLEIPAELD